MISTRTLPLFAVLAIALPACTDTTGTSVSCSNETAEAAIQAHAGSVQADGSVTVYGTVQFSDSNAELTVRAVYVAGVPVTQTSTDFNFRTWSVAVPQDRIAALAAGTDRAALPVVAYLFGGCVVNLPANDEPVVPVSSSDGGDAGGGGVDGSVDAPAD